MTNEELHAKAVDNATILISKLKEEK